MNIYHVLGRSALLSVMGGEGSYVEGEKGCLMMSGCVIA